MPGSNEDKSSRREKPGGRRRRLHYALLVVTVILAGLAGLQAGGAAPVFGVEYNGELIGVLSDQAAALDLIDRFMAEAAADLNREVAPAGPLSVVELPGREAPEPAEPATITAALRERVTFLTLAWAITVGGENALILATREEADQTLAGILEDARAALEARAGTEVLAARFREEVGVRQVTTHLEGFYGVEEAKRILLRGSDRVDTYVVKRNDSLWSIASAHRLSVPDLQRANPQILDPSLIRPGDQISLIVPEPYVNVETHERHTFTRLIAFGHRTVLDPDRWPHESYVQEWGVHGRELVTVEIARVNGQEVARETIEVVRQSEPRTQVNVKGSRLYPKLGSGSFAWPVGGDGGRVTSPFGWRWGGFHRGVDIATACATPVLAADAGTVTDTSYRGRNSYGWAVTIDHGAGSLVTLYAHLDANIPVKVGQVVEKGQVIGYVGTSGRSTGPHLHFEVRVDGEPVNPLNHYPSGR